MAKETKLSEIEKGEITALKWAGKSQREISKTLGHNKTVICNYLESIKKSMEQENRLAGLKNYHHNSREVKRKLRQHQKLWKL